MEPNLPAKPGAEPLHNGPALRGWTAWIKAQRPARAAGLDPFKPHGFFLEQEHSLSGRVVDSAAILLTNKECPWRCLMCDLWKHTLTRTVPLGAIPRQIAYALERLGAQPEQVKLYNSGSFFDPAAIPMADYPSIAARVAFSQNVIVEAHPRLVGDRALRLRDLLNGSLEVALGLESVHPTVLPRLNKRFELKHFAQAATFLREHGIAVRVFVLVKPPFLGEEEAIEWALKSAEFAFACGASVVSLIPTRPGNGALDQLIETGEFGPPRLSTLERAFELTLNLARGRVFADLWNLEQFSTCSSCLGTRRKRLQTMNLTQKAIPPIACDACDERPF